jgi:hypothetical protein
MLFWRWLGIIIQMRLILLKGRLQSHLRMCWTFVYVGTHRKLSSSNVLGPVSFLALTRALFLSQVNLIAQGVNKFPKYFELF